MPKRGLTWREKAEWRLWLKLIDTKKLSIKNRIEKDLLKVQHILAKETSATNNMLTIYYEYSQGRASKKKMNEANQQFRSLLKAFGLGFLVFLPFSVLTIPFMVKAGRHFGIDILPDSMKTKPEEILPRKPPYY